MEEEDERHHYTQSWPLFRGQNHAMEFCTITKPPRSSKGKMLLSRSLRRKWKAGGKAGRASTDLEARLGQDEWP